jgi:hypothetical protein
VQGNLHARFQGGERPKGPTYPNGITNAEPGTGYQEGPLKEVERPVTSLLEPCAVKVARTVPRGESSKGPTYPNRFAPYQSRDLTDDLRSYPFYQQKVR